MKVRLFCVVLCYLWGSGCSEVSSYTLTPNTTEHPESTLAQHTPTSLLTNTATVLLLSNIVGEILSQPERYKNQTVGVTGYYRGWDLLKEVKGSPPITRSDWVIADNSGAIYVTGLAPETLDPASQADVWTVIHLTAIVENNQTGIFLKAQSIELIMNQ